MSTVVTFRHASPSRLASRTPSWATMRSGSVGRTSPLGVRAPTRETVTEAVTGVSPPKLSAMQPQYSAPDCQASFEALRRNASNVSRCGASSGRARTRSLIIWRMAASRDSGRTSNSHHVSGTLMLNPPRAMVCGAV